MQIKELIEKAKNGDEKAFEELTKHYEESFADMVVIKNNDGSLRDKAKEELPKLLRVYLNHDYTQLLHDYLRYYSTSSFTDKIRLSDTRDMDLSKLKEIYTKRLLEEFKTINKVLTEEELYNYTYDLISNIIDELSKDRENLATKLGTFFARQKRFVKTEEALLIRYILQKKYNDNIINFFVNKYKYILNEYSSKTSYSYLCENFRNIVVEVLEELSSYKKSIELCIKKKVQKFHSDYTKDIQSVELNIRSSDERKDELYEANSVLKNRVYEYYRKKVNLSEKELKKLIDENYESYFEAYVNGKCTKTLSQYILTRFSECFNKTKYTKKLTPEKQEEKQLTYIENEGCIDKKMKKLSLNCPYSIIRNELQSSYGEAIDDYFRKENKSDVRTLVFYRLKKKIDELSVNYSDSAIIESSYTMKRAILLNKIQDEEIVNEIIDNLTKYYISNKMDNTKLFEQVIIDVVENFDMEEYLMIKEIKEHINLKVLRRPKIK